MIDQKILRDALWLANNAWKAKEREVEYLGGDAAARTNECLKASVRVLVEALAERDMAVGPKFCPHEKHVVLEAVLNYFDKEAPTPDKPPEFKKDLHRGGWAAGWRLLAKLRAIWTDSSAGACDCHEAPSVEDPDMVWPADHVRRALRTSLRLKTQMQPLRSTKSMLVIPGSLDQESACSHQSILRRENFAPGDTINVPEELGGGRAMVGPNATSEIAHCVCGQMIWSAFPLTKDTIDLGKYLVMFIDEDATAQFNAIGGQEGE